MITTILGMCIGMVTFGNILDKFGPRLVYSVFLIALSIAVYLFSFSNSKITILIGGAIVGFFVNGMFAGYGAMITRLYPHYMRTVANNIILNVGRAIGGFSSVVIGYILQHSNVTIVMIFLSVLYGISLLAMLSITNLKKGIYETMGNE